MSTAQVLRVGIDVGGTFTDLAAADTKTGDLTLLKVSTTPREPDRGVLDAIEAMLARCDGMPAVELVAHSTTIATNALLGQMGLELARVAMIATQGFRDVIEIGRQNRSQIYDLFVQRARPLVAREDRLTVRERIGSRGDVLVPLDEESLARACAALRDRKPEAVAVCLLNAYANDAHERRVAEAVTQALGDGVIVTRSSELDPEYREYERFSTTVVNAALAPIVQRYLGRLTAGLRARGINAPVYVMRSDGGMSSAQRVASQPAAIIESGPAGGVIAAAQLGGPPSVLTFDMGGTTAKAGAIVGGIVQVINEFEAAGKTHSGRAIKGSGYPVRFPFVDLAETSAGGGTIAWIDGAGSLRVGPLSAGADPGPACYGRSDHATVTDANVVLGRLHQTHLLGGSFPIDAARSHAAVEALAHRLGLGAQETARGIVTLIDAQMAKILRIVTVERGLDPRGFTLVAFGGGGPLHACALAAELGMTRVAVPAHPGVFSAQGLLVADVRATFVRPILRTLRELDRATLESGFEPDQARGRDALIEQKALPDSIAFRREYDARYRGQSYELTIEHAASAAELEQRFHAAHRARYGYDVRDAEVELVNARLTATGQVSGPAFAEPPAQTRPSASSSRRVWVDTAFAQVPVHARGSLAPGAALDGPAIVEQYDTTTYVAPGWSLHADATGSLIMSTGENAARYRKAHP